jgi:hypothetical protein
VHMRVPIAQVVASQPLGPGRRPQVRPGKNGAQEQVRAAAGRPDHDRKPVSRDRGVGIGPGQPQLARRAGAAAQGGPGAGPAGCTHVPAGDRDRGKAGNVAEIAAVASRQPSRATMTRTAMPGSRWARWRAATSMLARQRAMRRSSLAAGTTTATSRITCRPRRWQWRPRRGRPGPCQAVAVGPAEGMSPAMNVTFRVRSERDSQCIGAVGTTSRTPV